MDSQKKLGEILISAPRDRRDFKQEQGAMTKESPENNKECLEIKNRIAKIKRINRRIGKQGQRNLPERKTKRKTE